MSQPTQTVPAIRIHRLGGPEVLQFEETTLTPPGEGEALVEIRAAGVNYIDVYYRKGQYKSELPFIPGVEGAGVVQQVGPNVEAVRPGDRVAYAMTLGSYAARALVPAERLVPLPDSIDFPTGATAMVQGMTAHYLSHSTFPLKKGDTALVHAGAGGVGLLLTQMADLLGARVIATVSTEEKERLAREAGAHEVIRYTEQDFDKESRHMTDGRGVDVVYDSVGRSTFEGSLSSLRTRGYLVLFGQSSGPVPPFDPQILNAKGSVFLTRPSLNHYALSRDELLGRARRVFDWIETGKLRVRIGATYPLSEARRAHEELEGRRTTGKLILTP